MTTIPAILCSYADDRTAALGLLENIQRTDLNPFEQAQGLRDERLGLADELGACGVGRLSGRGVGQLRDERPDVGGGGEGARAVPGEKVVHDVPE